MKTTLASLTLCFALTAAVAQASPPEGALRSRDRVQAHSSITYQAYLLSGESTRIAVNGDHSTDLDLCVYDSNGNCVDYDNDNSHNCLASITPLWSGNFTIRVENRGSVWNDFGIVVWRA
jgi:hypothetical protein